MAETHISTLFFFTNVGVVIHSLLPYKLRLLLT